MVPCEGNKHVGFQWKRIFSGISQRLLQVNEFLPRTHRAGATWLKGVEISRQTWRYFQKLSQNLVVPGISHYISESNFFFFFFNMIKLIGKVPLS